MTRRDFFGLLAVPAGNGSLIQVPNQVSVPVHLLEDEKVAWRQSQRTHFWDMVWPEAERNFQSGGVRLEITRAKGSVGRPAWREPVITGLRSGVVNVVVTDLVPLYWDNGRAWSGVTLLYRGHALCLVAANRSHGDQLPLISVNTCVHEMLHALLLDVFERKPSGVYGHARELRVDAAATRLWLFGDGLGIRACAPLMLERLRTESALT